MSKSAKVVLGRVLIKRGRQRLLSGEEQISQIRAFSSAFDRGELIWVNDVIVGLFTVT